MNAIASRDMRLIVGIGERGLQGPGRVHLPEIQLDGAFAASGEVTEDAVGLHRPGAVAARDGRDVADVRRALPKVRSLVQEHEVHEHVLRAKLADLGDRLGEVERQLRHVVNAVTEPRQGLVSRVFAQRLKRLGTWNAPDVHVQHPVHLAGHHLVDAVGLGERDAVGAGDGLDLCRVRGAVRGPIAFVHHDEVEEPERRVPAILRGTWRAARGA